MVCVLSTQHAKIELIGDHVVFLSKDLVCWEESSGGVVEQTEEEDVALGVLDSSIELLAVVVDTDELDEELLNEQHESSYQTCSENLVHDLHPVGHGLIVGAAVGIACHELQMSVLRKA